MTELRAIPPELNRRTQSNVIAFPTRHAPLLTKRQLANHLGRSTRWVELRVREGMPARWDRRGLERRFDLADVSAWLLERVA